MLLCPEILKSSKLAFDRYDEIKPFNPVRIGHRVKLQEVDNNTKKSGNNAGTVVNFIRFTANGDSKVLRLSQMSEMKNPHSHLFGIIFLTTFIPH